MLLISSIISVRSLFSSLRRSCSFSASLYLAVWVSICFIDRWVLCTYVLSRSWSGPRRPSDLPDTPCIFIRFSISFS